MLKQMTMRRALWATAKRLPLKQVHAGCLMCARTDAEAQADHCAAGRLLTMHMHMFGCASYVKEEDGSQRLVHWSQTGLIEPDAKGRVQSMYVANPDARRGFL